MRYYVEVNWLITGGDRRIFKQLYSGNKYNMVNKDGNTNILTFTIWKDKDLVSKYKVELGFFSSSSLSIKDDSISSRLFLIFNLSNIDNAEISMKDTFSVKNNELITDFFYFMKNKIRIMKIKDI